MEEVISVGIDARARIIKEIGNAQYSVKIAMAYFTDTEIADALIQQKKSRGIRLQLVINSDEKNQPVVDALNPHSELIIFGSGGWAKMHHKFCIIDDKILIHGSYNFTLNAAKNNEEALNVTDSQNLIQQYNDIFNKLLLPKENKEMEEPSVDKTFTNIINPRPEKVEKKTVLINTVDDFIDSMENHIRQAFSDYNPKEKFDKGYADSKGSAGSELVFKHQLDIEFAELEEKINHSDDLKQRIKARMSASFENFKKKEKDDEEQKIGIRNLELKNSLKEVDATIEMVKGKIDDKKGEVSLKKEEIREVELKLEKTELQLKTLQNGHKLERKWSFGNIMLYVALFLIGLYLMLVFSSAFWKVVFEETYIFKQMRQGYQYEDIKPSLVQFDAIKLLYKFKGPEFAVPGVIFFLFPLIMAVYIPIKFKNEINKNWMFIIEWILGVLVFDIAVAFFVANNNSKITSRLTANDSKVVFDLAFFVDFIILLVISALAVIAFKYLFKQFHYKYKIFSLRNIDLNLSKEVLDLENLVKDLISIIKGLNTKVSDLEENIKQLNEKLDELKASKIKLEAECDRDIVKLINSASAHIKLLADYYTKYTDMVDSNARAFINRAMEGRVNAYKEGFFKYLTDDFSDRRHKEQMEIINASHNEWSNYAKSI